MMEIVHATNGMVNSIRMDWGVYLVISPRHIVEGTELVTPPYPLGSFVYSVPGSTSSSIDKIQTFDTLYLRQNKKGEGRFVYNINTNCAEKLSPSSYWYQ